MENQLIEERNRLDAMAETYFSAKAQGPDRLQKLYCLEKIIPHVLGPDVLEMSYNDGLWTDALLAAGHTVTIVEGARNLIDHARRRYADNPRVTCVHSLFEEFTPKQHFDDVLMPFILEHVIDPVALLTKARDWTAPDGLMHVLVPNKTSMHRRIGLLMGLMPDLDYLDTTDIAVGHRRHYSLENFQTVLDKAGLQTLSMQGVFLKPVHSGAMMDWPEKRLEAFNVLAGELPPQWSAFLCARCNSPIRHIGQ